MNAVDTNILLYVHDSTDPVKQAKAATLVAALTPAVLFWQVACEYVAASRKLAPLGFRQEDALETIETNRSPLAAHPAVVGPSFAHRAACWNQLAVVLGRTDHCCRAASGRDDAVLRGFLWHWPDSWADHRQSVHRALTDTRQFKRNSPSSAMLATGVRGFALAFVFENGLHLPPLAAIS